MRLLFIFTHTFFILISTFSLAQVPERVLLEKLTKTAQPILKQPNIEQKTLSQGLRIYYLQNTELPILSASAFFSFGSYHDTKNQRGLAKFFMQSLATGGSKKYTSTQIDETLEFLAAKLGSKAENEISSLSFKGLLKDSDQLLDIFFSLIQQPAFESNRLNIIKKSALDEIKKRNEDPFQIASREFRQSLYGQNSPYAWLPTPETIENFSPDLLKKFHQQRISPEQTILAVSSPLEFKDFLKKIEPFVKEWQSGQSQSQIHQIPALKKEWTPSAEFIHKDNSNQSSIIMGHFGEKRFNEDKYALVLINQILGGSTFGSKLGDRIRTQLGLAYSVGSYFDFGSDYGMFAMAVQTKSESTFLVIDEMQKIFRDMVNEKNISQAELDFAKDKILNSIIFEYEQPFQALTSTVKYDYFGYPQNYLQIYQEKIQNVTLDEILKVLHKYFFPEQLKIMIVGDRNAISGSYFQSYTDNSNETPKLGTLKKHFKEISLDNE